MGAAVTLRPDAVRWWPNGSTSVVNVLASVVFVPSAPLLVPQVAGPGATDTEAVREATRTAGRELAAAATEFVAIGARDDDSAAEIGVDGDFGRFGVPMAVTLRRPAAVAVQSGTARKDTLDLSPSDLPLSMLIAGWLRAESGIEAVEPVTVARDALPADCTRVGAELRRRIDADPGRVGVLVVADGATALSARAPGGGLRPGAVDMQRRIDQALAAADTDTLAALDPTACAHAGVAGRPAWQVAAALCSGRQFASRLAYRDAPFGVGYTVVTWTPR